MERKSTHALKKAGLPSFGISDLKEGYYEMERKETDGWGVKVSLWQPVRIWFGPPPDPETGEELDRSHRWQAVVDGEEADPYDVWTRCCHRPISIDQYCELLKGNGQ